MKSSLPKVLHPICSKPMVSYVIEAARKLEPKKIILVISRKKPGLKAVLDKDVKVAYQEKPLGTADATRAAKGEIPTNVKDVIVLYGDTPLLTESTIRSLYDFHTGKNASCTVLTTFLDNPKGYGRILRNETGQLIGIVEDKDANFQQKSIREVNTGMYCFKKEDLLEGLEHVKPLSRGGEFYLTDILSWLFNKNKKIDACVADSFNEVLGVNSQVELAEAAAIIRKRTVAKFMESGVCITDATVTFIDETAKIGPGTKIFPFTVIEKNVVVGRDCILGPFCHLREGSVLKDRVSVGNYTEIKNSSVGDDTRIRHIAYLGDTTVGKKANIGAGTVVANFDGKKKHKTVIKDKAFVGCDTVLIAPVIVGKNSVVGAGSVVTKNRNVPDNAIVAGVPARVLKKAKGQR